MSFTVIGGSRKSAEGEQGQAQLIETGDHATGGGGVGKLAGQLCGDLLPVDLGSQLRERGQRTLRELTVDRELVLERIARV